MPCQSTWFALPIHMIRGFFWGGVTPGVWHRGVFWGGFAPAFDFRKAWKYTRLRLEFTLYESLATSLVYGSRNPARKTIAIGYSFNKSYTAGWCFFLMVAVVEVKSEPLIMLQKTSTLQPVTCLKYKIYNTSCKNVFKANFYTQTSRPNMQ